MHPCQFGPHTITIDAKVPSKKNSYQIRYGKAFYKAIASTINSFKAYRKKTAWIGPSQEIKDFEKLVAWKAKAAIPQPYQPEVGLGLCIIYSGQGDLDNMLGAILDGLEQSGRVSNDRQFKDIRITADDTSGAGCIIQIWQQDHII